MHNHIRKNKYTEEDLKRLFPYRFSEDLGNAISHCVGAFLALGMLISLTWIAGRYGNWLDGIAFIFYGITILFMFVMSTVYHSMVYPVARDVLKRLDHVSIFILILGSYTPYVFSLLNTRKAYIIYAILVFVTIIGIVYKSIYAGRYKKIGTLIYVLMGWFAGVLLPEITQKLPTAGVYLMLLSGLIYSFGALFYAFSKFKYSHMVWHIFVLLGVIAMYISIAFFILQYR